MNVEIHPAVVKELAYMVELQQRYGAPCAMNSVEELVAYVLASVADGSRRPGSWERQMLYPMGLIAECAEHESYRAHYGKEE